MSNEVVRDEETPDVSDTQAEAPELLDAEEVVVIEAAATIEDAEVIDPLFIDADDDDDEIEVVAPSEADALRAELEQARAELEQAQRDAQETKNRMLRAAADFENSRKRANKEREENEKYGIERLVRDFLPIVDNLERALSHASSTEDASGLGDGVAMVLKQFRSTLERYGVHGFVSVGERFDPERHEAIQQVDTEEQPSNTVVQEFQKGYFLHERLLRPALVVVARNPSEG